MAELFLDCYKNAIRKSKSESESSVLGALILAGRRGAKEPTAP